MTERSDLSTKVWAAPVLEELTIDLTAIASNNGNGADGNSGAKGQGKTKS